MLCVQDEDPANTCDDHGSWNMTDAPVKPAVRTYRVADESSKRDAEWAALLARDLKRGTLNRYNLDVCPSVVLTWDQLAAVNEPETMEEIDALTVGERTVLGQCDPIERVS